MHAAVENARRFAGTFGIKEGPRTNQQLAYIDAFEQAFNELFGAESTGGNLMCRGGKRQLAGIGNAGVGRHLITRPLASPA